MAVRSSHRATAGFGTVEVVAVIDPREAETRDAARGRMPQFLRTALAGKIGLLAHLRAEPLFFSW